jgi:hypothetical protein
MVISGGAGCVGAGDDAADGDGDVVDVAVGDTKADAVSHVNVGASATTTVAFTATGTPLDISVDCGPPDDPDTVGMQFTVTSAALGLATASPARAGYWQWSGDVDAGPQKLKLRGKSGSASCTVRVHKITGSCTTSTSFRSPVTGHTHITVGSTVSSWGTFPVSGNHWGAWSKWDTVYTKPIKRGFLLHNLEHGGIVLSYNCSSPTASADCAEAAANLEALKSSFGESRVIVTPDPSQPTRYGARAWRWGFQSACYDEARMLDFLSARYRHGREDEDSDPPIPFDPTTQNVPCQDLMAAPDSCN